MKNKVVLSGDGFNLQADPLDLDPKNPNIVNRGLQVVKDTLGTKYISLVPRKKEIQVKYKGVEYLVIRTKHGIVVREDG